MAVVSATAPVPAPPSTQIHSGSEGATAASPPGRSAATAHTRTYQACIPCRRRKVRCDLGPVDNPNDPPCVRCRRESKECFFSATRRKRKPADGGDGVDDGEPSDYEIRNGRKRLRASSDVGNAVVLPDAIRSAPLPHLKDNISSGADQQQPLTPGGSVGRLQPLRKPGPDSSPTNEEEEEDQQVNNEATKMLQKREVFSGHDALNLLFEAAGRNGDILHQRTGSSSSFQHQPFSGNTPGSHGSIMSPQVQLQGREANNASQGPLAGPSVPIDPAVSQSYATGNATEGNDPFYEDALKAWSKFRFVRAGWFTAKEGVAYIDYFYSHLSPLTPLVVPDFRAHSTHSSLLADEPMLVITLLTISSRYMQLSGPGGTSRPYAIHARLWKYLQGMIERLVFAQEQFGGGFCGAGAPPSNVTNPFLRRGLRTLGTIESLMILTEWHPRALHFPPGDDNELVLPDDPSLFAIESSPSALYSSVSSKGGYYGRRIDSCLEPCWRSDRMCWMLLGIAMSLAFELGVFDEMDEAEFQEANREVSELSIQSYLQRKQQLRDLLLVYITQTSGRLGFTSMLSKAYTEELFSKSSEDRLKERIHRLCQRGAINTISPSDSSKGITFLHHHMSTQETVLYFWVEVAALMDMGNIQLFPSRKYTRGIIASGKYVHLLQAFQPVLRKWRKSFDDCYTIPKQMRDILTIEYEYCRVYINSVALQAVVERCANNTPNQLKGDGEAIPISTLMRWYGNDRQYIWEVIDASRKVLQVVVDGLYANEHLKHAPVRTYFRIISVAIILLKTFALGATEKDVAISLGLMDRAIEALRTCIVDDVHVGVRFADLLVTLANRIRSSFVRMASSGGIAVSRGASPCPPQGFQPPMGPPQMAGHLSASQWGGFNPFSPGSPSLTGGRATPTNPLYGISTETYDPGTNNVSIMPPPSFAANGSYDGNSMSNGGNGLGTPGVGDDGSGAYGLMHDWLALPLDPLLNTYGADVNQTTYGPDVGGFDLLDVLLSGMNGSTPTN